MGLFDSTTDELQMVRWRVQQWSALTMSEPKPGSDGREVRAQLRTEDERLARFAAIIETALRNKCAHYEPTVQAVRLDKRPQLLFTLTVPAEDEGDAKSKARHWIDRACQTRGTYRKIGQAGRSPVSVKIPMGEAKVERI